jgi:hypothetical protein
VWESQPESRVGRSDMRVDDDEYMDTVGRMSDMPLGRSGRARARGESAVSTITGISSALSPSPSVAAVCSSWARLLRAPAWCDDTAEAGDVYADELELAMLVELSVAAGSAKDLDLSRPCFCRNLVSFEPCCGLGGAGGALRDCLDIVLLVVAVVLVDEGCVVVVTGAVDAACRIWLVATSRNLSTAHSKIIQHPQSRPQCLLSSRAAIQTAANVPALILPFISLHGLPKTWRWLIHPSLLADSPGPLYLRSHTDLVSGVISHLFSRCAPVPPAGTGAVDFSRDGVIRAETFLNLKYLVESWCVHHALPKEPSWLRDAVPHHLISRSNLASFPVHAHHHA